MIFEQHYLDWLSQASYFIGDESSGRAVVVDPRRDVAPYLESAAEHAMTIELVLETHFHADDTRLAAAGFVDVSDMLGGYGAWTTAELELTNG